MNRYEEDNEEPNALKKLFSNPYGALVAFLLGCLITYTVIFYPFVLIGVIVISAMAFFAFRDRLGGKKKKRKFGRKKNKRRRDRDDDEDDDDDRYIKPLKPCPECGSKTKHRKTCSKSKEGRRRTRDS